MSNEINRNDESIFEEILKRSATDRQFRDLLVSEPAAAIEQVIGVPVATLPRPINVQFVEKPAGLDALIVLPDFVDTEAELSDAELETVAGGCTWTCACSSACCITNTSEQPEFTSS